MKKFCGDCEHLKFRGDPKEIPGYEWKYYRCMATDFKEYLDFDDEDNVLRGKRCILNNKDE
jgi:hypothetical protein